MIAPHVFVRVLAMSVCRLNECFAVLNPWLVIQSPPEHDHQSRYPRLTPVLTSVLYAFLEPLATKAFLWLPLYPWLVLMMAACIHVQVMGVSTSTQKILEAKSRAREIGSTGAKHAASGDVERVASKRLVSIPLLASTGISAITTASLLSFALSLQITDTFDTLKTNRGVLLASSSAIFFNILFRFLDYVLAYKTHKLPLTWARSKNRIAESLGCLVLLFVTRSCVRAAVGINPVIPFRLPDSSEASALFEPARLHYDDPSILRHVPKWLMWPMLLLAVVMGRAGDHFLEAAAAEDS